MALPGSRWHLLDPVPPPGTERGARELQLAKLQAPLSRASPTAPRLLSQPLLDEDPMRNYSAGFNFMKEIPPLAAFPQSPAPRPGTASPTAHSLLAVPADVESRAGLGAGRQRVVDGACARHTPPMQPALHFIQSLSKHLWRVCSGPVPGPACVLAVRKSGSNEACFRSLTQSMHSCVWPSPLSTYCVLGTRPDRETRSHQETRVKKRPGS